MDHVVGVFMGHEFGNIFLEGLDYAIDLLGGSLFEEVLEETGSDVVADVGFEFVVLD